MEQHVLKDQIQMPDTTKIPSIPTITPLRDPFADDVTQTGYGYIVVLYNDDYHHFDDVILQLQRATGCSLIAAEQITEEAHHKGRAIAYRGTQDDCETAAAILRMIGLQVETDRG